MSSKLSLFSNCPSGSREWSVLDLYRYTLLQRILRGMAYYFERRNKLRFISSAEDQQMWYLFSPIYSTKNDLSIILRKIKLLERTVKLGYLQCNMVINNLGYLLFSGNATTLIRNRKSFEEATIKSYSAALVNLSYLIY